LINNCNLLASHALQSSVADLDPHHFGKLDPVPHQKGQLDPDLHQSEKQDPDLNPHQSKKVEALECHFRALQGSNLGKIEY
jgi:hypothetical protein